MLKEKNALFIFSSDKVTYSKELSDSLRYFSNGLCDCGISPASFGLTMIKFSSKLLAMVSLIKNVPAVKNQVF